LNTFITFRVIFFAAIAVLALGPLGAWLAWKLHLVDVPGSAPHKLHGNTIPVAGGLIIFSVTFLISGTEGILNNSAVRPILLASILVFLFGLWDDFKHISPLWKLTGQLLAAVLVVLFGIQVKLFYQEWLNILITLVWIVGVTNAYNFVDSMDGLAVGLAVLAAAFFMLVTIDSLQDELSIFSTILLGACLGSFYYNSSPARYFLGDSGSQFLGFTLASLGIAYNPLGFSKFASWYVPILLVGMPIFDTALVVTSRLRRGKPVYQANRDHTYHRLIAGGMSPTRAVLTMHMASLLLGCLAFIALDMPPLIGNAIFGAVLFLGVSAIAYLDNPKRWPFPASHSQASELKELRDSK
jgi:UDP-GlcNAc:undecaprenyl-phosphate GlcNAc-1-phosphate transferase